jgi:hypothetical protein
MYFACVAVKRRTAQLRCTKCGSTGACIGCMPISLGRLFAFFVLHGLQAVTTFVQSFAPPRESGIR